MTLCSLVEATTVQGNVVLNAYKNDHVVYTEKYDGVEDLAISAAYSRLWDKQIKYIYADCGLLNIEFDLDD